MFCKWLCWAQRQDWPANAGEGISLGVWLHDPCLSLRSPIPLKKYEFVNLDDDIPFFNGNIKVTFQATNQTCDITTLCVPFRTWGLPLTTACQPVISHDFASQNTWWHAKTKLSMMSVAVILYIRTY